MIGVIVAATDSKAVYDSKTGTISIIENVIVYEVGAGYISDGVLMAGDVLVSAELNGKKINITRIHQILDMMLQVRAGDTVYITVKREVDGEVKEITVELKITEECLLAY